MSFSLAASCLPLLVFLGQAPAPSTQPTIRGTVVNARTLAPVADARVTLVETGQVARTAADGSFAFSQVPAGRYTLTISTISYIFVRRPLEVTTGAGLDLTIPLAEGTGTYEESVTVTPPPDAPATGPTTTLTSAGLQDLRGVLGDDPVRAVQALPGVATGNDFQSEFSVRGAAFNQVGIVIDGTATSLLFHTIQGTENTGSIAMINTDVLSGASLSVGAHPQTNGEWLGATATFDIREGSRDRVDVRAAVSGTNASFVADGPIGRRKRGSWLVSVRKSYIEWLVNKIAPEVPGTIGFSDLQSKLVYDLSARQQVQFLVVAGHAGYEDQTATTANGVANGTSRSALASASWRYTGRRIVLNQRVSFVANRFGNTDVENLNDADGLSTSWVWRADLTVPLSRLWTFDAGAMADHESMQQTLNAFGVRQNTLVVAADQAFNEHREISSGWAEVGSHGAKGTITAGTRVSFDSRTNRTAAAAWFLGTRQLGVFRFYASTGHVNQFPGLDALGEEASPLLPAHAWTFDAGVGGAFTSTVVWRVTSYYRRESNVIRQVDLDEFIDGDRIFGSTFPVFASDLDATSRGVDLVLERHAERGFTGWIGYTWSHTRDRNPATGETFDGDFDQRQTLNVFVEHRVSYRLNVSAKLRVGSNFPIVGYFSGTATDLDLSDTRNAVRLPTYARLDFDVRRTFTYNQRRLTVFVELVNALDRTNLGPSTGFIRSNLMAVDYTESMLPFLPSAGLLLEF